MKENVMIREALPEDLAAIWKIFLQVKKRLAEDEIPIWNDDYPLWEDFENDIRQRGILVAVLNGEIVGSISHNGDLVGEYLFDAPDKSAAQTELARVLAFCGTDLHNTISAHRLMVRPDVRGGGVAEALLHAMEMANAGRDIVFFAAPFNKPALSLYAHIGYRDVGEYTFSFGTMRCLVKTAAETIG